MLGIIWLSFLFIPTISSLEIQSTTSTLYLNSNNTIWIPNMKCVELIIPNNYKKVLLTTEAENISELLLTDIQITSTGTAKYLNEWSDNLSTISISNINPTKNDFNLFYCLDYSFWYACNNDFVNKNPGSLTINITAIKGEGCQIADFFEETECANWGVQLCKDQSKCMKHCQYVECLTQGDSKLFTMCLPANYTQTEITKKCDNHVDFKNGKVNAMQCTNTNMDNVINETSTGHKIIKVLAVIWGVLGLSWFISSIYYRFKTTMDENRPPFNPPWFCPNFIFPRVQNSYNEFN